MTSELKTAGSVAIADKLIKDVSDSRIESELQLVQLKNMIRALDESSIVIIIDTEGHIKYVNDKFCQVSKYSKEEILGKKIQIIRSDNHPPEFYDELWSTIKSGKVWQGEICDKKKDGTNFWNKATIVPFFDKYGKIIEYIITLIDITQQKKNIELERQLATSEERSKSLKKIQKINKNLSDFKSALDNSASVAITDVEGTITYANDMFCNLSKYSRDELIGKNHRMLKSGYHDDSFYENMWKTISSGDIWHDNIKNKRKDGTFYWVRTMIMPIFDDDNKIQQYIAIRTDITSQVELAERLVKAERLSSIGALASRMSHDLRNPLSVIKVSLENMKMLYGVDEIRVKQIEKIERSIDRMTHQVDGVLDFVRRRPLNLSKTMFSEIISESIDSLNIPDNIKTLLPKNDVRMHCDKKQFSIVMNNLILNSIQAIDGAGIIEISVEENNAKIVIQIKDSGKGISKKDLDKIFEPLFTTKQQGTGLGLSGVNFIIDSHRGIISVTSPPTIFTITLPKTLE